MTGGCAISMLSGSGEARCSRDIWEQDPNGTCYYHSELEKDVQDFRRKFLGEIDRLRRTGSSEYNFSKFILPDFTIESGGIEFDKPVIFWKAHFRGSLWIRKVHFRSVNFDGATFEHEGDFAGSSFQSASFERAKFGGVGRFEDTSFNERVSFQDAEFSEANFAKCHFGAEASFRGGHFGKALFAEAFFTRFVDFTETTFGEEAYSRSALFQQGTFSEATFESEANFGEAVFQDRFAFDGTRFGAWANFEGVRFEGHVEFGPSDRLRTMFEGPANFEGAVFAGLVLFEEAVFAAQVAFTDGEVSGRLFFQDVEVGKQGTLDFRYVAVRGESPIEFVGHNDTLDMTRVRLLHTDPMRLNFRNVRWWADRQPRVAFDKLVLREMQRPSKSRGVASLTMNSHAAHFDGEAAGLAKVVRGTTFQSVEALYRGLRRNYEQSLRYPEAGDFYVREMEMKRIGRSPPPGRKGWFRRNLSLLSIYGILSNYGESYNRALAWIVGSVIAFGTIRMAPPLQFSFIESLATSTSVFFQLAGETPLDQLQRLWSVLVLALFFLAVRRRLKR